MSPAAVSPAAGQAAVPPAHRPAAPARPNRSRLLNLGAPLVRLGDAARALLPPEALLEAAGADPAARVEGAAAAALDAGVDGEARTLGGRAGEHPVLAEFEAFVSDANALVSAVVDRWDTAGARPLPPARRAHQGTNGHGGNGHGGNGHATNGYDTRAPARSAPVVAPAEPAAVPQPLGPRTLTVTRTFSIDALPHVRDHCFYRQPPGWPHLVDRFPVIPMTALLEMMTDEARVFAPGRTAVGLRDVRALRWLAIEPAVEVTINLTELPDGAVRVEFKGYTRGTVVFADDYPPAPEPSAEALVDTRPPPVTASFLYEDGWMFHGPGYQGIHELGPISPGGLTGTVRAPDVPGALLDSVGQLFGFWGIPYLFSTGTSMMLPQGVGAIRFYGPQPPPGSPVTSTLWVRDVNDVTVKADFELRREDGSVWARIDGWTDHRFANDDVLWQMMRHPDVNTVAQRSDDGWMFAYEHATDSASRELISYHFLTVEGRALLAGRNPRAGRQWLLGRIAAHDAVRRFLWDHGAGPLWAIETQIDNEPSGRPVVARMPARPGIPRLSAPNVSLAHTQFAAVAMVHPDGEVGIDIEKVLPREPGVEAAGLTAAERALLDTLAGADPDARALWFTRMWSAKEAAAKADGTGLQGRPRRFVVDRIVDPAGEQSPDAPAMLPDAPAMLRVAIGGPAEQGQGQPAQGQPDGVAREGTRHRWVAHRLVDRVGLRMAAPSGGDCFVVAWTSPEIERAGQESDPREGVGA
jgi:phosphopantetheinyl transferase